MAAVPRFHVAQGLRPGAELQLPPGAARHVQVLRLQPGDAITLFGGDAEGVALEGEFEATVTTMGRQDVVATVQRHVAVSREASRAVVLAVGMPANERMDWLVEKATELGVAAIQPLMSERSVLRLDAARAQKKQAHWQSIAVAACEQCGRNRVPLVHTVASLPAWLERVGEGAPDGHCLGMLSFLPQATALQALAHGTDGVASGITLLLGPEGGLSPGEESQALARGFAPFTLGARVLRTDTAALAALAVLA